MLIPPYSDGVPWGIRTLDLLLRRQLLYPAELKARIGADDGNRTHVTSLEGWNSTIELHSHCTHHRVLAYYITIRSFCQYPFSDFSEKLFKI